MLAKNAITSATSSESSSPDERTSPIPPRRVAASARPVLDGGCRRASVRTETPFCPPSGHGARGRSSGLARSCGRTGLRPARCSRTADSKPAFASARTQRTVALHEQWTAVDLQIAVRLPVAQRREDAAQNLVAAPRDALSEPSSMARTASARCAAPRDLAQDAPQVAVSLAPAGPFADRLVVPGHTPTHRASRRAVPNWLLATRAERPLTELVAARKQVESCLELARRQIHQIDRRVLRRESPGGGECVLAVGAAHAVVREGQGGGSRGTGGTAERVGLRAVVRAVLAGDVERGGRGRGVPADGSDAGAVSALGGVPLRTGLSPANRPRPDEMLEFNALPPKGRLPEAGRDGERVKWERAKRKQAALRLAT